MTVRYNQAPYKIQSIRTAHSSDVISRDAACFYKDVAKRSLDIVFVLLALPIVVPLVVILAALLALGGGDPFFKQQRVGREGKHFTMWKLRTMVPDASAKLESYLSQNPVARKEWDETQKLKNDPRITLLGRVLRKTSLDELPQLINVLKGDMSLVGPRPMMPNQQGLYPGTAYYEMRPGITGLWQVSDRNDSSFASRADFDATYFQRLSLKTDLSIMYATAGVVFRGTGY